MAVLVPAIFRLMQTRRGFERGVRFIGRAHRNVQPAHFQRVGTALVRHQRRAQRYMARSSGQITERVVSPLRRHQRTRSSRRTRGIARQQQRARIETPVSTLANHPRRASPACTTT